MGARTYKIEAAGLGGRGAPIRRIVLVLQYRDEANHYLDEKWFILDAEAPHQRWTFTPPDPGEGFVFYSGTIEFSAGGILEIPFTVANEGTLRVGAVAPRVTVAVLPLLLDWTHLRRVTVQLEDPQGEERTRLSFTPQARSPQYWSVEFPAEGKYAWAAEYQLSDGSTWSHPRAFCGSPILVLPAPTTSTRLQPGEPRRLREVTP